MTGQKEISYTGENGQTITFSAEHVTKIFAQGTTELSIKDVARFMRLCEYHQLNPYIGEAYPIKYGNGDAQLVVSKDVPMRKAGAHPEYDGHEAGILLFKEASGESKRVVGSVVLPGWELLGGWAVVHRKDRKYPVDIEVALSEYIQRKKDGTVNKTWDAKPGTMIRKVALSQGQRECFPVLLQKMYGDAEISTEEGSADDMRNVTPVNGTEDVREKVLDGMKVEFSGKLAACALPKDQMEDMGNMLGDITCEDNPRCLEDMAALSALLETAIVELPKEPVVEKPKAKKKTEEDDGAITLTEVLMNEIREVMSDNIFEKTDRAGVNAKVGKIPADHPQVLQRLKKLRDSCKEERKRRMDEHEKAEKEPAAEDVIDIPFEGVAPPEARTKETEEEEDLL